MEDRGRDSGAPDFGTLLRRYRLDAGLSQEALAERARLSLQGIRALERGYRRTPQRDTVELLARALALNKEQRREFEACAVRASSPRRRGEALVTVGPWPSAGSADLPFALTRFVGRGAELEEIAGLVREHRFVTITGAGGIGKTQTALRVAGALVDGAGNVTFAGFAHLGDPSLVGTTIATAVRVQEVPNHTLLETLIVFLKNKRMLLVLDNCEHVIGEVASLADSLLHACPNLKILATSREPLRAAGERAYRLPSLGLWDAAVLFLDRAQAVDAHFVLTDEDRPIVNEICTQLSGIPLAIELAAVQVNAFTLRSLAAALESSFGVLIGGERSAQPRQQTMRAAIDWSYALLSPQEQVLFARLSVFVGGCTFDIAKAVCQGGDVGASDVLPLISSLVNKSLIVADLERDGTRYRLLEPFREYAHEKLKVLGEHGAIAQRHLLAYLDLVGRFARHDQHYSIFYGHPRKELGNWRAAVQWGLIERNDVLMAQRLVAQVVCSWSSVLSDARRWIPAARILVNDQTPPNVVARLMLAEATLAGHLDYHASQLSSARCAIAYLRKADDQWDLMRALVVAGNALFDLVRYDDARVALEEALRIARRLEAPWDTANVLRNLACCYPSGAGLKARRVYLTEAEQIFKEINDEYSLDLMALDFASLVFDEGNPESAVTLLTDQFARGFNALMVPRIFVTHQLGILEYLLPLGRYEEMLEYARRALSGALDQHLDVSATQALGWLATIATLRAPRPKLDVDARAARVLGFVEARLQTLGSAPQNHELTLAALREAMGAGTAAKLMAEGAKMTEDETVESALML